LTCPYNTYGRVWLTTEEFYQLQEDRIISMTSDFLQTFPEEIKDEFLEYTVPVTVPVSTIATEEKKDEEGKGDHGRHGMREIEI
jgi:hypothetical protein